jgi:hypothetical protein
MYNVENFNTFAEIISTTIEKSIPLKSKIKEKTIGDKVKDRSVHSKITVVFLYIKNIVGQISMVNIIHIIYGAKY